MPNPSQQIPLILASHNNQSLFSDHYLDDILRHSPTWQTAVAHAHPLLDWLRDRYAQEQAQLTDYKEAQLEENWFKPIFERLGHVWEVQAAIPGLKGSTKKPDYAFFPDEEARQTAVSHQNTPLYPQHALAIGEVKQWEVNLSKKTGTKPIFDDQNPMFQIDTYLTLTGLEWGILSNGRFWRLLHKSSSRTLETYFEIDLLAALNAPSDTAATAVIAYFWLFFNQTAFRPDAHGHTFLNNALKDSRAYAIELETNLRDNAYRSLEQLIIGFFAGDATLDKTDPTQRLQVYQNSLYLLYRLLFLIYGESRALLPMHNPAYKDHYSLQQLAQSIDKSRNTLETQPTTGKRYWNRLGELFRLIGGSDPQLNADLSVPRYNGGLFDAAQHPFLEQHFVGDRFLAKAIDYLAYRRIAQDGGKPAYQAVDYRTLDVRQLGSIYEGMLEYKVAIADEEMVTISKSGVETWVPISQKGKAKTFADRRQPGDLYLTNDKGERKATGSYYTPDYIVEYIVENTLGPLVEQARERVKAQTRQTGSLNEAERQRQSAERFIAEILRLNVLDPAMGSGHFLVEATHYLARALATDDYVQASPAQTGPFSQNSPIAAPTAESDLLYWKRRVVEACIYGVDKNPMAVELAKLSLWLKTAAADKPLSFLDHHLRHGDSLIGAWLNDLSRPPRPQGFPKPLGSPSDAQHALFDESAFTRDINRAVADVMTIERLPSDDIETVHAKEIAWQNIQQTHVARWQTLADLWVSAYFGNTMTPEEYRALADRLQGQESLLTEAQTAQFLAHPAANRQTNPDLDYFHWELAFPEVFFDEYGRSRHAAAGFDAVIGNPPYVRQEQLTPLKPFFSQHFANVYAGTADLFVYFFAQGITTLKEGGLNAYISSNSWLRANYATALRAYLRQNTTIEKIIDLGDNRVFADAADLYPAIHVVQHSTPPDNHIAHTASFNRGEGLENFSQRLVEKLQTVTIHNQTDSGWQLDDTERKLFDKIMAQGESLESIIDGKMYRGVLTGLNEAFIIDHATRNRLITEDPNNQAIIKPMLRGADLRPWYQAFQGEYLIFTRRGIDIDQYPVIKQYLDTYRQQLEPKPNDWPTKKHWAGRKAGSYRWYEIQDSVDYYSAFDEQKISWPDITKRPRFSFTKPNIFLNNTGYLIPSNDGFLLGYLQSRVTWFTISKISIALGERAGLERYRLVYQYMSEVPIPLAEFNRDEIEKLALTITQAAQTRYQLHEETRHRIITDLNPENHALNNALTAWWDLNFVKFRAEIKKVFKRDIPLKERHEWELYLADAQHQHQQLTAQIITQETQLNAHVYKLFHLTPEEIHLIEQSTKYNYGEV